MLFLALAKSELSWMQNETKGRQEEPHFQKIRTWVSSFAEPALLIAKLPGRFNLARDW